MTIRPHLFSFSFSQSFVFLIKHNRQPADEGGELEHPPRTTRHRNYHRVPTGHDGAVEGIADVPAQCQGHRNEGPRTSVEDEVADDDYVRGARGIQDERQSRQMDVHDASV